MSFFLAIDAGGTSTRCALASPGRVLARASTGSVKLMRVSVAEATTRLHAMLTEVSASAGVPLNHITRTCFGLAGLTIPAVRAWAAAALAAQVSGSLILCGDEEIALDAAFAGGPGILVIAGTGSNIIGRDAAGALHSAGGWGPILGDEGAGYWIGLEALRAALRARDRDPIEPSAARPQSPGAPSILPSTSLETPGAPSMTDSPSSVGSRPPAATPSTQLLAEIQLAWNLKSLPELIELGNHRGDAHSPAPDFASLAPIVARLAEPVGNQPPNPIAAAILHQAGVDLADQVTLVATKLVSSSPEIAFTGSVLTHIAPVRQSMIARLAVTLPAARVQPTAIDPLDGALYRARLA